jgi:hypothetical protein
MEHAFEFIPDPDHTISSIEKARTEALLADYQASTVRNPLDYILSRRPVKVSSADNPAHIVEPRDA